MAADKAYRLPESLSAFLADADAPREQTAEG